MIKRSLKYIAIAVVNLIVLTVLLVCWTDKFQLIFDDLVRPVEFLKIMGFTVLALIGMRILAYFLNEKNISTKIKLELAILLTILISSYLYVDYSVKIYKNVVLNGRFRNEIAEKIHKPKELANGMMAEHLTNKEYQEIARVTRFPKIPVEATDISYDNEYDGFLPDYSFELSYYVPKEMKVDTVNFENGDFSKHQTYKLVEDKKLVTYSEGEK